jgi:hypothetical protein
VRVISYFAIAASLSVLGKYLQPVQDHKTKHHGRVARKARRTAPENSQAIKRACLADHGAHRVIALAGVTHSQQRVGRGSGIYQQGWTDEADAILRQRRAAGDSASSIATEHGTSRGSVIGRAHQLGLRHGSARA